MEEQKYFTPKEEDLRLGFEYEEYLKYQNKWENRIITELSNDRDAGGIVTGKQIGRAHV